ncbi:MAG: MipA/OmpV family protein [Candidatus Omnitrophota bacterium]
MIDTYCVKKILIFLVIVLTAQVSYAEETGEKTWNRILGIGWLAYNGPYKDKDADLAPVLITFWQQDRVFIRGSKAGYVVGKLKDLNQTEIDLYIEPRFMGYSAEDSAVFQGMSDRKYSADIGVQFKGKLPDLKDVSVNVSLSTDLLAKHEGQEIKLELLKSFDHGFYFLRPGIGVEWQSKDMVDYYYGVCGEEVTTIRFEYSPNDAINFYTGIDGYLGLSENWLLVGNVCVYFLHKAIKNSPIVDSAYALRGIVGVSRKF